MTYFETALDRSHLVTQVKEWNGGVDIMLFLLIGVFIWLSLNLADYLSMTVLLDMSEETQGFHKKVYEMKDIEKQNRTIEKYLKIAAKRRDRIEALSNSNFIRIWLFITFRIRKGIPDLPEVPIA